MPRHSSNQINIHLPNSECESFQRSIQKFLNKRRKRQALRHVPPSLISSITQLSNHSIHVLKTLIQKRHTLSLSISGFEQMCTDGISVLKKAIMNPNQPSRRLFSKQRISTSQQQPRPKIANSSHLPILLEMIKHILQHFFLTYIHIKDSVVLLTSGECRNKDDSRTAKRSTEFPSQLNQVGSRRRDGYTVLYSSKLGYSGYGWDEFHNENVGLRVRLLDKLCSVVDTRQTFVEEQDEKEAATEAGMEEEEEVKEYSEQLRNRVWDSLLDYGAQSFELQFDAHQTFMKESEDRLDRVRTQFISNLERLLSTLFTSIGAATAGGTTTCQLLMKTKDKQEQLRFQVSKSDIVGLSAFTIQRQGDGDVGWVENKLDGFRGLLPTGRSQEGWNQFMALDASWKKDIQNRLATLHSTDSTNSVGVRNGLSSGTNNRSEQEHSSTDAKVNKSVSTQKRKFVIEDSDDDTDTDENMTVKNNRPSKEGANNTSHQSNLNRHGVKKQRKQQEGASNDIKDRQQSKQSSIKIKETVAKNANKSEDCAISSSTLAIKQQLGVNVNELQQSLEMLQQEEMRSKQAAVAEEINEIQNGFASGDARIDNNGRHSMDFGVDAVHHLEEINELGDRIMETREQVDFLRSVCAHKSGSEEAWDSLEFLRESLMTLGILNLELHDCLIGGLAQNQAYIVSIENQMIPILRNAECCFLESVKIVKQLYDMNKLEETQQNQVSGTIEDFRLRTRALLLCRGRALTNLGRSYFEQSEIYWKMISYRKTNTSLFGDSFSMEIRQWTKKSVELSKKAIKNLEDASQSARTLRSHAVVGCVSSNMTTKAAESAELHQVEAQALGSLICRWQGLAFWSVSRQDDCFLALERAAFDNGGRSNSILLDPNRKSISYLQAQICCLMEQYHGAESLIQHISLAIARTDYSNQHEDKRKQLQGRVSKAYDRAAQISKMLTDLSEKLSGQENDQLDFFIRSGEIEKYEDIMKRQSQVKEQWDIKQKEKRTALPLQLSSSRQRRARVVSQRGDIFNDQSLLNQTENGTSKPRVTFVVGGAGSNSTPNNVIQQDSTATAVNPVQNRVGEDSLFGDLFDGESFFNQEEDDILTSRTASVIGNTESNSTSNNAIQQDSISANDNLIQYRKWGDSLLIEEGIDIDAYPSCAPETYVN